ncbi:hypothetical protein IWQ56_004113 [Coemansia nantahalensis]|uniref:Uncharacterized protein n=1 Tax=Coemansia helicoidea TaxID=1286919 RepID=A0ACC1KD42_9FUNG|nr:hypothetical protein IWQ56_004113 [Coemansia nantahalensis]KAJ2786933.1 hypothetical protein H4R21_007148 [Coemansia helicoidea]
MFMPGMPDFTPEQQAEMRRETAKGFLSFFGVVAAIRVVPWALEHLEKALA